MTHKKFYSKKIIPNRFVTHVSCSSNRNEILANGIIVSRALEHIEESTGVFAHNSIRPESFWYPFILERWENNNGINYSLFDKYDYWVIDTQIANNEWYYDNVASIDFGVFNLYIMTKQSISAEAISLFKFQQEKSWEYQAEGAFHVRSLPSFRPFK